MHKYAYMAWDRILVIFATIGEKENFTDTCTDIWRYKQDFIGEGRYFEVRLQFFIIIQSLTNCLLLL